MNSVKMRASRPYLLRAFYDWIVDNHCTPYLVVNADYPGADVPEDYVEDGQIVLNIDQEAVQNLKLGNKFVTFEASFAGVPHVLSAPIAAVLAIYAQENGRGMVFSEEDGHDDEGIDAPPPFRSDSDDNDGGDGNGKPGKKGHLRVVK